MIKKTYIYVHKHLNDNIHDICFNHRGEQTHQEVNKTLERGENVYEPVCFGVQTSSVLHCGIENSLSHV